VNGRGVVTIGTLTIKRIARDRSALFFILLLPAAIIFVIGTAIGGIATRTDVGVVGGTSGPLARDLRASLRVERPLRIHAYRSAPALRAALRHGDVFAGVIIPPDYDTVISAGRSATIAFLSDPTRSGTGIVRSIINANVDRQAAVVGAARAAGVVGVDFATGLELARVQAGGPAAVSVQTVTVTGGEVLIPAGFAWTAPTNLVLFVFITSLASSGRLVMLRTQGLAARIAATPVGASTLLFGELFGAFMLAVAQGVFIIVLGSAVFGVHWGALDAAIAVLVMAALVATGLGVLLGTLLRTPEQAASIGPPIGIALGMLGGCMWPLAIVGTTMRAIGHLTPQAWAMDAFIKLIGEGKGVFDIGPQLLVLAAFAAALIPLATWRLRRVVIGV
jgi:ABC-2 type transport system permease protein